MIHHVSYEVFNNLTAQELSFWSCFGFHPTGLRRRSRKQAPIHWLVCGDEAHAVELLPVDEPSPQGLTHVAYVLPQRRWEIATKEFERFGVDIEPAQPHLGHERFTVQAPSGYHVEILKGSPSLKAGPPLTE